jgi:hypothetical protein
VVIGELEDFVDLVFGKVGKEGRGDGEEEDKAKCKSKDKSLGRRGTMHEKLLAVDAEAG